MIREEFNRIRESHLEGINHLVEQLEVIEYLAGIIVSSLRDEKKVLIAGNGGSAADSQHFAAELVGRFEKERKGFAAIALTTDTSILTAVGNDYGFKEIFRRQVEGLGKRGDVFIGISTSGNSENVILAVQEAKRRGIVTVSFTGRDGGKLRELTHHNVNIPLNRTARIQEMHITLIHLICDLVEKQLTNS